jgi:hypothetical protein
MFCFSIAPIFLLVQVAANSEFITLFCGNKNPLNIQHQFFYFSCFSLCMDISTNIALFLTKIINIYIRQYFENIQYIFCAFVNDVTKSTNGESEIKVVCDFFYKWFHSLYGSPFLLHT